MIEIYDWDQASPEQKEKIMDRAQADMEGIKAYVAEWLEKVRTDGDAALVEYTRQFDKKDFTLAELRVTPEDIERAYQAIDPNVLARMREQIAISTRFHEAQMQEMKMQWEIETVPGVTTGIKVVPIDAVGLYVPAGKAPLPTVEQTRSTESEALQL